MPCNFSISSVHMRSNGKSNYNVLFAEPAKGFNGTPKSVGNFSDAFCAKIQIKKKNVFTFENKYAIIH